MGNTYLRPEEQTLQFTCGMLTWRKFIREDWIEYYTLIESRMRVICTHLKHNGLRRCVSRELLVAPSRRAERLIYSLWCPDGCMVGCLLTFRTKFRKFHRISKIPKRDHVSRHSEQLWFLDSPPRCKGNFRKHHIWLDICSDQKKNFFFKFFFSNFF